MIREHDRSSSDNDSEQDLVLNAGQFNSTTLGQGVVHHNEDDGHAGGRDSNGDHEKAKKGKEVVAWADLPRKDQLIVLTLARLSEPLVQTSLQAYLFYQLKWFDPTLPDSTISAQAGILYAGFTAAQFLTAMLWGRIADSHHAGRKLVLLIGLFSTSLSCLGFGFSTTFWQALLFRTLGGITNGNVGVMRTMISEIIKEKKYQSRAFLLMPMTFNIGVIIGPPLGGILSDPAGSYPSLFGNNRFFKKFPYALPSIVSAFFLFAAGLAVLFRLEETLDARRDRADWGLTIGGKLGSLFSRHLRGRNTASYRPATALYDAVPANDEDVELNAADPAQSKHHHRHQGKRFTQRLAFRRIFTRNVLFTLLAHFLLAFHIGTFNSLWFVFLSTPVWDPATSKHKQQQLPFRFTGGLGLQPKAVGVAMAVLGVVGINMQLILYPRISARAGTTTSWRASLLCFPVAYFLVPYLATVHSSAEPPAAKTGIMLWLCIFGVLLIQVTGRTFALPAQGILVNNCSPHPSVLGTVHGLAQSVSSAARTIGPMIGGFIYGVGLNHGVVGAMWWALSCVAICGIVASQFVHEGDGHEIWLEGDEDGSIDDSR